MPRRSTPRGRHGARAAGCEEDRADRHVEARKSPVGGVRVAGQGSVPQMRLRGAVVAGLVGASLQSCCVFAAALGGVSRSLGALEFFLGGVFASFAAKAARVLLGQLRGALECVGDPQVERCQLGALGWGAPRL